MARGGMPTKSAFRRRRLKPPKGGSSYIMACAKRRRDRSIAWASRCSTLRLRNTACEGEKNRSSVRSNPTNVLATSPTWFFRAATRLDRTVIRSICTTAARIVASLWPEEVFRLYCSGWKTAARRTVAGISRRFAHEIMPPLKIVAKKRVLQPLRRRGSSALYLPRFL